MIVIMPILMKSHLNGHYDDRIETVLKEVEGLKEMQTQMIGHLEAISQSTKTVADVFEKFSGEDRKELKENLGKMSDLAAGRKQIPSYVFVIILILWGAYTLIDEAADTNVDIDLPYLGIKLTHGAK